MDLRIRKRSGAKTAKTPILCWLEQSFFSAPGRVLLKSILLGVYDVDWRQFGWKFLNQVKWKRRYGRYSNHVYSWLYQFWKNIFHFPCGRLGWLHWIILLSSWTLPPRPPRFNRKMPWEKGIRISGSVAKLSNGGKGKYTKLILWMEEILHRLGCKNIVNNWINYLSTGAGFLLSTVSRYPQINGSDRWFWMVIWNAGSENPQRIDILPTGKKEDFQPDLCLPRNCIITMKKDTIPPKNAFSKRTFSGATSLCLGAQYIASKKLTYMEAENYQPWRFQRQSTAARCSCWGRNF